MNIKEAENQFSKKFSTECEKEMEKEGIIDLSEDGIDLKKEIIFCEMQVVSDMNFTKCIAGIL